MTKGKTNKPGSLSAITDVLSSADTKSSRDKKAAGRYSSASSLNKRAPGIGQTTSAGIVPTVIKVGGVEYKAEAFEADPGLCRVNPKINSRQQRFLSEKNRNVRLLIDKIAQDGQREPIYVRPIADAKRVFSHYEVIAGSRRLWVVNHLNQLAAEQGGEQRKIKVINILDIPDASARELSISENVDREDESPYEIGCAIAEEVSKGRSVEAAGADYNLSKTSAYRYAKLAKVDVSFLEQLSDPGLLGVRSGEALLSAVEKVSEPSKLYEAVLFDLSTLESEEITSDVLAEAIRSRTEEFLKTVKPDPKPMPKEGQGGRKSRESIKRVLAGGASLKCSKARAKEGKWTIHLEAFPEDKVEAVLDAIERAVAQP